MDAVSQVLVERRIDGTGLDRMLGASAVAHLALVAVIALVPAGWLGTRMDDERVVMSIDLGGPVGPRDGGLTAMGGRPIQQAQPVEPKKALEPVRPPAAAEPEMIEPIKTAPRKQEAPVKTKMADAKSSRPTKGEQVRPGTAVAETGGKGKGFGLTSGGGGTGAQINVGDFCCPEYIALIQQLINRNWSAKQQVDGTTIMKVTIERDGRLMRIQQVKSSGQPTLDYLSERALLLTKQLPPLPAAYTNPALDLQVSFEYSR